MVIPTKFKAYQSCFSASRKRVICTVIINCSHTRVTGLPVEDSNSRLVFPDHCSLYTSSSCVPRNLQRHVTA